MNLLDLLVSSKRPGDLKIIEIGEWKVYLKPKNHNLEKNKTGKWMHFFNVDNKSYIDEKCKEAVESDVVCEAKFSFKNKDNKSGVACFYINGDDIDAHKRVISFFLKNRLIPKTKKGLYTNISFKYDNQTRASEYGTDFEPKISLSKFINLETGEWLENI